MNRLQGLGPLALALFTLLATACSSTPDDTSNDPSESADELRGACGGIANLACKSGYQCSITEKHPDATGVCKKVCGGIANLACSSSYECVVTDKYPDATGLCTKKGADAMCGGIANIACAAGYDCVVTATYPDASGVCKKKSNAPACTKAADCKGMLPQSCQVCSDGSNGCAHWSCDQGACAINYCK